MGAEIRYTLRRLLQKDILSSVWLADCSIKGKPKSTVVLKSLHDSSLFTTAWTSAFQNRCSCIMKATSPLHAPIVDFGFMGRKPFVAVKHYESVSLRTIIDTLGSAGITVPVWFALPVMLLVCRALKSIHAKLKLHSLQPSFRLSPSKILFTSGGLVRIAEHGIFSEKLKRDDPVEKQCYCAPEHTEHDTCTMQSDIYAIGAIFYETLSGRTPVRNKPILPLLTMPWVPEPLQQLILSSLDTNPKFRPADFNTLEKSICQILGTLHEPLTSQEIVYFLKIVEPDISGISSAMSLSLLQWEKETRISNMDKFNRFATVQKALDHDISPASYFVSLFYDHDKHDMGSIKKELRTLSSMIKAAAHLRSRSNLVIDAIAVSKDQIDSTSSVYEETRLEGESAAKIIDKAI